MASSIRPSAYQTRAVIDPPLRTRLSLAVSSQRPSTLTQKACLDLLRNSPMYQDPVCREIVEFVASSKRGVCSPRAGRHHKLADGDLSADGEGSRRGELETSGDAAGA